MLRLLGRPFAWLATFFGFMIFLAPVVAAFQFWAVFAASHAAKVDARDVCHLNGTSYSHLLLPDGRLSITLTDAAVHAADAGRLAELFPDPAERAAVIAWGRRLVASCRDKHRAWLALYRKPSNPDIEPPPAEVIAELDRLLAVPVTDAMAAHAAWRRLTCAPGASPEDLPRVREIVASSAGDAERLAKLLKWAGDRRTRLETATKVDKTDITLTVRPAPPDTEWFRHWIVYDQFAATDEMLAARKSDLLEIFGGPSNFGRDKWAAFLEFGREALKDRSDGDAPLPDDGERSLIVAAVDRLSGLDPDISPKLRETAESLTTPDNTGALQVRTDEDPVSVYGQRPKAVLASFFPFNDDIGVFALADEARRPGRFYQISETDGLLPKKSVDRNRSLGGRECDERGLLVTAFLFPIIFVPVAWMAFRAMRAVVIGLGGRLLLLGRDPLDKRYPTFRDSLYSNTWHHMGLMLAVVALSWAATMATLDPLLVFWTREPGVLLYATAWLVMFAGAASDALRNLITLVFIRLGSDPERTFLDDLLGAGVTVGLMLYFDNGPVAICSSVAVGIISPWMFSKLARLFGGE